jgi:hypothetical protein
MLGGPLIGGVIREVINPTPPKDPMPLMKTDSL